MRSQIERLPIELDVAETGADRVHPAAPSFIRVRIALAGLAKAELTRQLEVPGRLLRKQRNRIKPGHADGKDALARADLDLLTLERGIESNLRFAPPTGLHHAEYCPRSGQGST